jgi:hypothetical protein
MIIKYSLVNSYSFLKISETDNYALEPFLRVVGDEIFTNSNLINDFFFK